MNDQKTDKKINTSDNSPKPQLSIGNTLHRTRKGKGTRKYPSRREARQFMLNHKHINGRLLGTHRDYHATFTKQKHMTGMVFVKPKNKGDENA